VDPAELRARNNHYIFLSAAILDPDVSAVVEHLCHGGDVTFFAAVSRHVVE
jgi:hypothetical protein